MYNLLNPVAMKPIILVIFTLLVILSACEPSLENEISPEVVNKQSTVHTLSDLVLCPSDTTQQACQPINSNMIRSLVSLGTSGSAANGFMEKFEVVVDGVTREFLVYTPPGFGLNGCMALFHDVYVSWYGPDYGKNQKFNQMA